MTYRVRPTFKIKLWNICISGRFYATIKLSGQVNENIWNKRFQTTFLLFNYVTSIVTFLLLVGGGTAAITWPIVPVPGDCEDGEVSGMKWFWQGKPKYSEKTCPDSILSTTNPTCQSQVRTRSAAVGSQRLTASAMARPTDYLLGQQLFCCFNLIFLFWKNVRMLMRAPCCLSLPVYPSVYVQPSEYPPYFLRLMRIMI
jgi:hypothetical protein